MKNTEGQEDKKYYQLTVEGSLGLLAYGDIGLRAWRKVKRVNQKANDSNETK